MSPNTWGLPHINTKHFYEYIHTLVSMKCTVWSVLAWIHCRLINLCICEHTFSTAASME